MNNNIYRIYTPAEKKYPLIHDLVIRNLVVNADPRGTLTEVMKTNWEGFYNLKERPFAQCYFSVTEPSVARDQSDWHFHPGGQVDRFSVISGDLILAVYDIREKSPTKDLLNLFLLGESLGRENQYSVLVPPQALHGFLVVSRKPATLINFPSRLYDPKEELRLPFRDYLLPDGSEFSWNKVKNAFEKYDK